MIRGACFVWAGPFNTRVMASAKELLARMQSVDIRLEAVNAFNQNAEFAEGLNRVQLKHGVRGDGTVLPDYSFSSVHTYGKPPGPIRLYDKGDFYAGINYAASYDRVYAFSSDDKAEMLEARYGEAILSLLPESKQKLWQQKVKPTLVMIISSKTGLRIGNG